MSRASRDDPKSDAPHSRNNSSESNESTSTSGWLSGSGFGSVADCSAVTGCVRVTWLGEAPTGSDEDVLTSGSLLSSAMVSVWAMRDFLDSMMELPKNLRTSSAAFSSGIPDVNRK